MGGRKGLDEVWFGDVEKVMSGAEGWLLGFAGMGFGIWAFSWYSQYHF